MTHQDTNLHNTLDDNETVSSDLSDIQQGLFLWLLREEEAIKSHVVGRGKANVEERLKIYSNAYRFRLIDALSETFPSMHTLMGDDHFYTMSLAYIDAYPSHHFSLRYFGNQLETFLADYEAETPLFSEMAKFEWALRNSFDSADIEPITLLALQQIAPELWGTLGFQFHPSVQRLNLNWNTPQLWSAIEAEEEPIPPQKNEYPIPWVVSRNQLMTYYRSLDADEAWALDQSLQGSLFAALCEGVCEWIDAANAPARIAGFIAQWIEDGYLIDVRVHESS